MLWCFHLVTQKGFEPLAFWFVVKRSIQLSYWVMYLVLTYINTTLKSMQAFFNNFLSNFMDMRSEDRNPNLAGAVGLEPTTNGFGDRYSTNWAIPLCSSSLAWYLISLTNIRSNVKKERAFKWWNNSEFKRKKSPLSRALMST